VAAIKPSRDIRPVTEFRANASRFISQVRETRAPVYLTQHGKGAAVLLDVEAYEAMVDELALLRGVQRAERDIAAGRVYSHAEVMRDARHHLKRELAKQRRK
jgi:antitoxin YefM